MRTVDLIRKKRFGDSLSPAEIRHLIMGYTSGSIPDYQMSALLMAITVNGMTEEEMSSLTTVMMHSGAVLDLGKIPRPKVDKHSTGGVGDKTSLIVAPAVAAAGLAVPMISGRGLAHTGGTLDKLESIPGFNVHLSPDRFITIVAEAGACLCGQTEDLVPADRKLYSLRDVTGTVDCIPLIAASIMSKKMAEGIDALVLDVKTGSGAFMKQETGAEALARAMVGIGRSSGLKVVALITDMNQPLGEWVGNSVEVVEALEVLKGRGPDDLRALCTELSAHCLVLGGAAQTLEEGREKYQETIASGRALAVFRKIIRLQGGDAKVTDDYSLLPKAPKMQPLASPCSGYVAAMDTEAIGIAMSTLGAGRERVDSVIDASVGMQVHKKVGDAVEEGESLCTLWYRDDERFQEASRRIIGAYRLGETPGNSARLVHRVVQ